MHVNILNVNRNLIIILLKMFGRFSKKGSLSVKRPPKATSTLFHNDTADLLTNWRSIIRQLKNKRSNIIRKKFRVSDECSRIHQNWLNVSIIWRRSYSDPFFLAPWLNWLIFFSKNGIPASTRDQKTNTTLMLALFWIWFHQAEWIPYRDLTLSHCPHNLSSDSSSKRIKSCFTSLVLSFYLFLFNTAHARLKSFHTGATVIVSRRTEFLRAVKTHPIL